MILFCMLILVLLPSSEESKKPLSIEGQGFLNSRGGNRGSEGVDLKEDDWKADVDADIPMQTDCWLDNMAKCVGHYAMSLSRMLMGQNYSLNGSLDLNRVCLHGGCFEKIGPVKRSFSLPLLKARMREKRKVSNRYNNLDHF